MSGTKGGAPYNGSLKLTEQDFFYALHNGLNHVMVNAVWLKHLSGPENHPGDLQLSKVAYGVLRGVPVYQGTADQKIWMLEQVLSTGFLF